MIRIIKADNGARMTVTGQNDENMDKIYEFDDESERDIEKFKDLFYDLKELLLGDRQWKQLDFEIIDVHGQEVCCECGDCEICGNTLEQAKYLARLFHELYEMYAPEFGYKTRKASAVEWEKVPKQNKRLMIKVCSEILRSYKKKC